MKFKKKFMKGLAISMAFSMIFTTNAFATPIDLANSEMDAKTDTLDKSTGTDYFADENNEWLDGTINEEVRVTVDLASEFEITIPKEIVLDGETGKADYKVKAIGDIAGDQKLSVIPDPDFVLSEAGGKADVTATVTQPDTEYVYTDLQGDGTEYDGSIAATLTAGEWSGKFNFNIKFEDVSHTHSYTSEITKNPTCTEKGIKTYTCSCGDDYTEDIAIDSDAHNYINGVCECGDKILEGYSWAEITTISESGEAANYFAIGDTKEMTLSNGETYNAEIIGFNHDDLANGTGKAGITFQFKECMTTEYAMNSTQTNVGGWEASEMRTYVNNDVFALLPAELQAEIKTVDKVSDAGNKDKTTLIHTSDKLFLLSFEEVGFTSSDATYFVAGQGTKYEKFTDKASRVKDYNYWWLRSANAGGAKFFFYVMGGGSCSDDNAIFDYGVAPAFCI